MMMESLTRFASFGKVTFSMDDTDMHTLFYALMLHINKDKLCFQDKNMQETPEESTFLKRRK